MKVIQKPNEIKIIEVLEVKEACILVDTPELKQEIIKTEDGFILIEEINYKDDIYENSAKAQLKLKEGAKLIKLDNGYAYKPYVDYIEVDSKLKKAIKLINESK